MQFSPEMAAEAMHAHAEKTNRLNRERRANGDGWCIELAKVEKAIAGMIAAIEEGLHQPSMNAHMEELERQNADLTAWLTAPTRLSSDDVAQHMAIFMPYAFRRLAELEKNKTRFVH